MEQIDIAKHKELFEYEMTEVILALKGEFATVSKEGTKFSGPQIGQEKLNIPQPELGEVQIAEFDANVPEVACSTSGGITVVDVQFQNMEIPVISISPAMEKIKVNVSATEISIPLISENMKTQTTDCSVDQTASTVQIPSVLTAEEMSTVSEKMVDVQLPTIAFQSADTVEKAKYCPCEIHTEALQLTIGTTAPELPVFSLAVQPEADYQKKIDLPASNLHISEAALPFCQIEAPEFKAISLHLPAAVNISIKPVKELDIAPIQLTIPQTPSVCVCNLANVHIQNPTFVMHQTNSMMPVNLDAVKLVQPQPLKVDGEAALQLTKMELPSISDWMKDNVDISISSEIEKIDITLPDIFVPTNIQAVHPVIQYSAGKQVKESLMSADIQWKTARAKLDEIKPSKQAPVFDLEGAFSKIVESIPIPDFSHEVNGILNSIHKD